MRNTRFLLLIICLSVLSFAHAQKHKVVRKSSTKTSSSKKTVTTVERSFGTPTSITSITDLQENSPAYESVKNLVESYSVPLTYSDNTFHGKEMLRRGDFIVALNGAYNAVKTAATNAGLDTSILNTYDRNRTYLTSINDLKGLSPQSIYFNAAQSLIEKWGVAAPFAKSKVFNANSPVSETEAYDILKVTLGYTSGGSNGLNNAITREKFALVLNNAIAQKVSTINALHSANVAEQATEQVRAQDSMENLEMLRKQAMAKEIELKRMDAQKKEAEARQKLKNKK